MFRSLSGYKAQYHDLTLLVVSELNEWKVMLQAPDTIVLGVRQFDEHKAKEHALSLAQHYLDEEKHAGLPAPTELQWSPTARANWLLWMG